jgi:phthiocerol/phenolphthiocerol synthesis type-I polyketide synthase C
MVVLTADRAHTGVFSLDARQWFQSFPAAERSSLFAKLGAAAPADRRGGGRIRAEIDELNPGERPARLASAIADEVRAVLRSAEELDHDRAMESLGLDSLMALELRNRLEASLGITLPVALVWAYPTIAGLASALCERMGYEPTSESPSAEPEEPDVVLSDDELDLLDALVEASELEATTGVNE